MLISQETEIPWTALRYLTGEVVYGGRVTDHWDRRCLNCTLSNFYNPDILNEGFCFSTDGVYCMISESMDFLQCINSIESIPDRDSPGIFGMQDNAEKAYLGNQAKSFMTTIKSIEPRLSAGVQTFREQRSEGEIVFEKAESILKKLPETVEGIQESDDTFLDLAGLLALPTWTAYVQSVKGYDSLVNSALLVILRQEISRFNRLLSVVCSSLHSLCLVVKGQMILTDTLEETYNSFLSMKMPKLWQQHSYESCKPLASWIDDLAERVNFFRTWSRQFTAIAQKRISPGKTLKLTPRKASQLQEIDSPEPYSFWLSAFFFPQGLLTALLQNHARKNSLSVDNVTFEFHVQPFTKLTKEFFSVRKHQSNIWLQAFKHPDPDPDPERARTHHPAPPDNGAFLLGLYLDGACWDHENQVLQDSSVGQRYSEMPEILFLPVQVDRMSAELPGKRVYECPLYRTSQRAGTLTSTGHSTNFVIPVNLPTHVAASYWVTRGVALLCQLDD
ncbi:dynein axonemal heavy chain 6-like isoform X1 [Chiloscyllium punctatum]|uniref:dynein axonemal heavy chain 6-like isoform X1 n=1 Tax=Chiloscyllium punctatum TaxID=137246 RepID=UPI003B6406F6